MLDRFLARFGDFITARRGLVIGALALLTVLCASQIPKLRTDSSPENLIISFGGYEERVRAFRENFGDTDSVVALLISAEDATALTPLRYVHRLSRHFQSEPTVVRVDSLTVTPLPGSDPVAAAGGETLEDLDDLGALEDLDDLDDLEDGEGDAPLDPRFEAALETLIASDADRFPMGLYTVAERVGDGTSDVQPVVAGDEVSEAHVAAVRRALADAPLIEGRLVSADRGLTAVVLRLDPALGTGAERIAALRAIDAWLAANPTPEGVTLNVAGLPHLRAEISERMTSDQTVLVPMTLLVCVLLLYASFRWLPGMMLPLVTVGMTVMIVIGTMAAVGEPMTILMNVLPTLLIIIGLADSVHLIGRYGEELRRSGDRVAASKIAMKHLAVACFLTSFTTAAGLGALMISETQMLRRFGLVGALGTLTAYVVTICFVPAALTFFAAPTHKKPTNAESENIGRGLIEKVLVRMTARIVRRPWIVIAATLAVAAPAAWSLTDIRTDTSLSDTFEEDDPIVVSMRLVDRQLSGVRPLEIVLDSDDEGRMRDPEVLAAMDRVSAWLDQQPGILRTTSASDYLWETWRRIAGVEHGEARTPFRSREQVAALATLLGRLEPSPLDAYLTSDGRHARIETRLGDIGAQRSIRVIRATEERLQEELGSLEGVRWSMVGEAYIGSHGVDSVVRDTIGSLTLSMIVIFTTLTLLFRSIRLGLLSIPPNIVPLLGCFGWMWVRGIALDASTAIVFSVAIGVSVDSTIHAFARLMEEERRGLNRRAAILRSARGTGRAIVVSTVTLVLGFCVLLFSGFVPVRHFGELIAAALTMSLLSTLLFQPALLKLFGGAPRRK
ncbi:MAG: efflux RND transporter permease subunit [Myxococcota bacterium]|nr:efflux RND transporter permease subunit [Myxococcota bacterium]